MKKIFGLLTDFGFDFAVASIKGVLLQAFVSTFVEVQIGELLCYKGSNATLEIAVRLGSARDMISAKVGMHIIVLT